VYLVLCHLDDRSAVRVYCALRAKHGSRAVELVSSEELMLAPRWRHALDSTTVLTELELADGRHIHSDSVGLVLQRILRLEPPQFQRSGPDDREYAAAELHALFLSWLEGLACPVVNRAGPRGLSGADRSLLEWMRLAALAGLSARGVQLSSDARRFPHPLWTPHLAVSCPGLEDPPVVPRPELLGRAPALFLEHLDGPQSRVLVAGTRCLGAVPDAVADGCVRLAHLSGDHLLGVRVGRVGGEWRFCGATPNPEIPRAAATFVADSLARIGRQA
jgi:hypothetical protein